MDEQYRVLTAKSKAVQDVAFRRLAPPIGVETILEAVAGAAKVERSDLGRRRRDSRWRAVAAQMLCMHGGLNRREAAAMLGLGSGAAVSRLVKVVQRLQVAEASFGRKVKKLDRQLKRVE